MFGKEKIEVKSEGYLNNLELRFPNEPARHKLLDIVGDLALIGYPIKAKSLPIVPATAAMSNLQKRSNNTLKSNRNNPGVPCYNPTKPPVYDR